jgi:hypothetical protein
MNQLFYDCFYITRAHKKKTRNPKPHRTYIIIMRQLFPPRIRPFPSSHFHVEVIINDVIIVDKIVRRNTCEISLRDFEIDSFEDF